MFSYVVQANDLRVPEVQTVSLRAYDVAAVNEIQTISCSNTGGTLNLYFRSAGLPSSPAPYASISSSATFAQVRARVCGVCAWVCVCVDRSCCLC